MLAVADTLKPDAAAAVSRLKAMGVEVAMLTGANQRTAAAIAAQVGITRILAEVLPTDKVDEVRRLQGEGQIVAMVGDGVNDASGPARADRVERRGVELVACLVERAGRLPQPHRCG